MAYTTIDKGSKYFNTKLYTGNGGSSQSITGVGFQPDFVWIKDRPLGFDHNLFDSVRGIYKALNSNQTYEENFGQGSNTDSLTSFDADGFSVGGDDALNDPYTYVSWNWLGANTTVSNTSGSITSTVSANTTSGFSIVSYTGTGANATVGHGLGATPRMIILKNRDRDANWIVYHKNLTSYDYRLNLDSTAAQTNSSGSTYWTADPTSTLFSIGDNVRLNASTEKQIAYCFNEIKGFSKFSSFVGNGSTDGAFVYTGFKPAFVIIKASSTGGAGYNWGMWDNKRDGYNVNNNDLRANLSNAESTDDSIDLLSNGFKMRTDSGGFGGGSGVTYIYMAFAENPFVSSKGICTTAR